MTDGAGLRASQLGEHGAIRLALALTTEPSLFFVSAVAPVAAPAREAIRVVDVEHAAAVVGARGGAGGGRNPGQEDAARGQDDARRTLSAPNNGCSERAPRGTRHLANYTTPNSKLHARADRTNVIASSRRVCAEQAAAGQGACHHRTRALAVPFPFSPRRMHACTVYLRALYMCLRRSHRSGRV
jgi:hypothetical protein